MFPALTESMLRRALRQKDLRVDGVRTGEDCLLEPGAVVSVYIDDRYLLPSIELCYEEDRFVVAVKPAGIAVEGPGGLAQCLGVQLGQEVYPAHRLDVPTHGLVMLAKSHAYEKILMDLFRSRELAKTYRCVVSGKPVNASAAGILETGLKKHPKSALVTVCALDAPGAKRAKTGYRVIKTTKKCSLLEVDLYTGRTHQIRVHMAHLGCPIIGDDKYGDREINRALKNPPLALCACKLTLFQKEGPLEDLYGRVFEMRPTFMKDWEN